MSSSILLVGADALPAEAADRFERRGWSTRCVADANAADLAAGDGATDAVLLDAARRPGRLVTLLRQLRDRDTDTAVIVFVDAEQHDVGVHAMQSGAEAFLTRPVDAAHLELAVERAVEKTRLRRRDRLRLEPRANNGDGEPGIDSMAPDLPIEEVERQHIARALLYHDGNRSKTARSLGISRATLYDKLARYGLDQIGRSRSRTRT